MNTSPVFRAAYALTGLTDPAIGDERERTVILRAYTFSMVLAMLLGFFISILFAVVGLGLWSVAPMLIVAIPSWASIWFAAGEGVDLVALMDRGGKRRIRLMWAGTLGYLLLWGSALSFHMMTGRPLVAVDFDMAEAAGVGPVIGGILGATVGILGSVIALKAKSKQTQRRIAETDED